MRTVDLLRLPPLAGLADPPDPVVDPPPDPDPETSPFRLKPSDVGTFNAFQTFVAANEWPATTGAVLGRYDVASTNAGKVVEPTNPETRLLVYINMGETGANPTGPSPVTDAWYSRAPGGQYLRNRNFVLWLANPRQQGWQDNRYTECLTTMQAHPYLAGIMGDVMGPGPIVEPYYTWTGTLQTSTTAKPVNPVTGTEYTTTQWVDVMATAGADIKDRLEAALDRQVIVAGNGLGSGMRYWVEGAQGRTSPLSDHLDAALPELFVRAPKDAATTWKNETSLRYDLDMLVDSELNKDCPLLLITKLWASHTTAQRDQWHKFSLAWFLLGTQGRSSWEFIWVNPFETSGANLADMWHPWWDGLDIGHPLTQYRRPADSHMGLPATGVAGVYAREFSGGLVLANPTAAPSGVYSLPRPMVEVDGTAHSGTVTLPAHTALILLG